MQDESSQLNKERKHYAKVAEIYNKPCKHEIVKSKKENSVRFAVALQTAKVMATVCKYLVKVEKY